MTTNTVDTPIKYEQRLILFLDILGFKNIVEESTKDAGTLASLSSAIKFLSELKPDEADIGKKVTQFSDSIVVSYPIIERSSVFNLVYEVSLLIIDLAYKGYLVRGGITFGLLIHTDGYLLGPAMIRAYEMESKTARHPRVLIDSEITKIARKYHAPQNSPDEEEEHVRRLMTKDEDGLFFFDYISWHSVVAIAGADHNLYDKYLERLGILVERGLRDDDLSVKEKYLWLHKRYVASIDEILREPEHSAWYAENIHVVESAKAVPRHESLVEDARRAVASTPLSCTKA